MGRSKNVERWREVDSIMYKEGKVYVPKDNVLRAEIIRLHHDTPVGGQWRTIEDNGIGHQELLVARSYERSEIICRGVQHMPV